MYESMCQSSHEFTLTSLFHASEDRNNNVSCFFFSAAVWRGCTLWRALSAYVVALIYVGIYERIPLVYAAGMKWTTCKEKLEESI